MIQVKLGASEQRWLPRGLLCVLCGGACAARTETEARAKFRNKPKTALSRAVLMFHQCHKSSAGGSFQ